MSQLFNNLYMLQILPVVRIQDLIRFSTGRKDPLSDADFTIALLVLAISLQGISSALKIILSTTKNGRNAQGKVAEKGFREIKIQFPKHSNHVATSWWKM